MLTQHKPMANAYVRVWRINADQYLTKDFGVFAKASYNDGHTETWFFTEIDRSVTFGGVLKGTSWKRKDDELGLAFIGNGLSKRRTAIIWQQAATGISLAMANSITPPK